MSIRATAGKSWKSSVCMKARVNISVWLIIRLYGNLSVSAVPVKHKGDTGSEQHVSVAEPVYLYVRRRQLMKGFPSGYARRIVFIVEDALKTAQSRQSFIWGSLMPALLAVSADGLLKLAEKGTM